MHLNSSPFNHEIFEHIDYTETISFSCCIHNLIIVAINYVIISLPRKQNFVIMLYPIRSSISIPITNSQLSISQVHCIQIILYLLQTILISRIGKDSDIYLIIKLYYEETLISRTVTVLCKSSKETNIVSMAIVP